MNKSFWVSRGYGVCRKLLGYSAVRNNDGVFAEYYNWKNSGTGADGSAFIYNGSLDDPILFGLQFSVGRDGSRIAVVVECHAVADKDDVFDIHAFTYKSVTGVLSVLYDIRVFLYLYKDANF